MSYIKCGNNPNYGAMTLTETYFGVITASDGTTTTIRIAIPTDTYILPNATFATSGSFLSANLYDGNVIGIPADADISYKDYEIVLDVHVSTTETYATGKMAMVTFDTVSITWSA